MKMLKGSCGAEQDRSHVDSTPLPCSLCGDSDKGAAGRNPLQKQSCVLSGLELSLQNRIYKEEILLQSEQAKSDTREVSYLTGFPVDFSMCASTAAWRLRG